MPEVTQQVQCRVGLLGLLQSLLSLWAKLMLGLWDGNGVGVALALLQPWWGMDWCVPQLLSSPPCTREAAGRPAFRSSSSRFAGCSQILGVGWREQDSGHLLPPLSQNSCGREGEQSQQGSELGWRKGGVSGFNPLPVCVGEFEAACTPDGGDPRRPHRQGWQRGRGTRVDHPVLVLRCPWSRYYSHLIDEETEAQRGRSPLVRVTGLRGARTKA